MKNPEQRHFQSKNHSLFYTPQPRFRKKIKPMLLHLIPFKKWIYCFPKKQPFILSSLLLFNFANAETIEYSSVFYDTDKSKICTVWCDELQSHIFCTAVDYLKTLRLEPIHNSSSQYKTICNASVLPLKNTDIPQKANAATSPETSGHKTCPALPYRSLGFFRKLFRRHILPSVEDVQYFWACSKGDFAEDSLAVLLPYSASVWLLKSGHPKMLLPIILLQPGLNIMGDYIGDLIEYGPQEISYSRLPQSPSQFLNELVEDYFKMLALTLLLVDLEMIDLVQAFGNSQPGRLAAYLARPVKWSIRLVSCLSLYNRVNAEADELGDNVAQSLPSW